MRWVRYDLEARRHHLPELLRGVRLALLPSEFLLKVVACEELVMADRRSRYGGVGGRGRGFLRLSPSPLMSAAAPAGPPWRRRCSVRRSSRTMAW